MAISLIVNTKNNKIVLITISNSIPIIIDGTIKVMCCITIDHTIKIDRKVCGLVPRNINTSLSHNIGVNHKIRT